MSSAIGVLRQLDREWKGIGGGGRGALSRWPADDPAVAGFASVGALVEKVNERGHAEESDALLLVLLRLAPFDDLAARTVLQAMMPAVKNLTAKFSTCGAWC